MFGTYQGRFVPGTFRDQGGSEYWDAEVSFDMFEVR